MKWFAVIAVIVAIYVCWRIVVGGAKGRIVRSEALRPSGRAARTFATKVVGVTRRNVDGRSRQDVIRDCAIGDDVLLVPEPDNPADPHAIAVYRSNGHQIGYLDRRLAGEVSRLVPRGGGAKASIKDIVGGTEGAPTLGVVLQMTKTDPE